MSASDTFTASSATRARLFARLAIGAFLASIAFGLLLPVYADEIGWRFQERAGIDGGIDIMFSDLCGPNSLARAPWFMMPIRWITAWVNDALPDPLVVRLTGMAFALLWALLLWTFAARLERDGARRDMIRTFIFALLGLGLLPLLMVMSRPEQPVILMILLGVMVALAPVPGRSAVMVAWLKSALILLFTLIGAAFHLKGVLYAPVALVCIAVCAKGPRTRLPRIAGIVSALAIVLGSAHYWVDRFQCPDDALLAAKLARENIAVLLTNAHDVPDIVLRMLIGANPFNYVMLAVPTDHPMSAWIPKDRFSPLALLLFDAGLGVIWLAAAGLVAAALYRFLRRNPKTGWFEPRLLIALAIMACILIWGASQLNRNVYEATHILPMLILAGVLCLSLPQDEGPPPNVLAHLAPIAVGISLASQIALFASLVLPFAAAARSAGYVKGQPYSVSIAGYGAVRRDIDRAMTAAGIVRDRRLNRLLIDDVTYLALQDSHLPLHRLGVLSEWNGGIIDPVGYLRDRGSDGVVVGCRYLPAPMRAAAARSGDICALSRATLDRLAR